jgi:outer membrane lipoprotein-sorting protein
MSAMALLLPALNGCLLFGPHTRKLQVLKMPPVVMNASASQLVQQVNAKFDATQSLTATVELQASVGGAREGQIKDYTSFLTYILLRKPGMLRVLGLVPVLRTKAFDLASNGETFKLLIPRRNKVIEGTNTVTKKSANTFENLRPGVFVESMLVQSIGPDDLVYLTTSTRTIRSRQSKQLMEEPDYDLSIVRRKEGGNELIPVRQIHFSRVDLLPFEQDFYDKDGNIETQAIYGPYRMFGTVQFPGTVTIKRPLEDYQIVLTVQKVTLNEPLKDNQFDFEVPEGAAIQKMD